MRNSWTIFRARDTHPRIDIHEERAAESVDEARPGGYQITSFQPTKPLSIEETHAPQPLSCRLVLERSARLRRLRRPSDSASGYRGLAWVGRRRFRRSSDWFRRREWWRSRNNRRIQQRWSVEWWFTERWSAEWWFIERRWIERRRIERRRRLGRRLGRW
jgi:hypothetical protein